ncbi:MAG: hypothetical protein JW761_05845 [Prolixibacteraceae bacterium]|nr:hypothetical protein [Prolixibacteraceae bacterium]
MNESKHIIQKVFVEVNTFHTETAQFIKNNIDLFLKNEILPEVELMLLKYDQPEIVFRLEKLDIQVSASDWENQNQLKKALVNQFEKELREQLKSGSQGLALTVAENVIQLPQSENREAIFLFFLENGHLPWYAREQQITDFIQDKSGGFETNFLSGLKNVLSAKNEAVERLVNQFSERLVVTLLVHLNSGLKTRGSSILQLLKNTRRQHASEFLKLLLKVSVLTKTDETVQAASKWLAYLNNRSAASVPFETRNEMVQIFLASVAENTISDKSFQSVLNKSLAILSSEEIAAETIEKESEKEPTAPEHFLGKEQHEIAVQNAGLIILHPFLKSFFSELKITDSKGKIKQNKTHVAVQVLHFLATGNENVFEGNLVFEKFLCGIPLKTAIQKESLVTPKIRKESKTLLEAVVKNWPALKNTSPDGLRQMFLQRKGILIQNEHSFKLIVERMTPDVLLEKISWNLSLIKLPWMQKLLYIDW